MSATEYKFECCVTVIGKVTLLTKLILSNKITFYRHFSPDLFPLDTVIKNGNTWLWMRGTVRKFVVCSIIGWLTCTDKNVLSFVRRKRLVEIINSYPSHFLAFIWINDLYIEYKCIYFILCCIWASWSMSTLHMLIETHSSICYMNT